MSERAPIHVEPDHDDPGWSDVVHDTKTLDCISQDHAGCVLPTYCRCECHPRSCDRCGKPATQEGWAYPSGGSFPVVGCEECLHDLASEMDVRTRPLTNPPSKPGEPS